jgi:hypothetical protein
MIIITLLLLLETISLIAFAYYDFKTLSVPKKPAIALIAISILLYIIFAAQNLMLAFSLAVMGAIFWFVLFRSNVIKQDYFSNFDKAIFLFTLCTLPFVSLFALMFQQGLLVLIAMIDKQRKEIPVMATYAPSFVLSALILVITMGIGSPYL